jgi:hypothetical protein
VATELRLTGIGTSFTTLGEAGVCASKTMGMMQANVSATLFILSFVFYYVEIFAK